MAPTATGPVYTTLLPLVTVMVWAPSATWMWNGFDVIVTSDALIHPVLPFGRTGSSTCTQPSLRCCSPGTPGGRSTSAQSGRRATGCRSVRAGAGAPGESYTGSFVTVFLAVAMYETSDGAVVLTGADVDHRLRAQRGIPPAATAAGQRDPERDDERAATSETAGHAGEITGGVARFSDAARAGGRHGVRGSSVGVR